MVQSLHCLRKGQTILISKKEIRKQISEKKLNYPIEEIKSKSNIIINKLLNTKEYKDCHTIFTYVSFNQEVNTRNLIKGNLGQKKIAVPKIADNKMCFYYINSLDNLRAGTMGILEPVTKELAIPKEGDLFIVPGLAFDKNKNRIGYGGGYYDKYFWKYKHVNFHKIALAFDFQIIRDIAIDEYDVKLDSIISPKKTIY